MCGSSIGRAGQTDRSRCNPGRDESQDLQWPVNLRPNVPVQLTPKVALATKPEKPPATAVRTTVGIGLQLATRLGSGETRALTLAVKLQVAGQIRPALTSRFDRTIAFQVAFRTTPGTVLRTVPTVTPRTSFRATLEASKAASVGNLGQFRPAKKSHSPRWAGLTTWSGPRCRFLAPDSRNPAFGVRPLLPHAPWRTLD